MGIATNSIRLHKVGKYFKEASSGSSPLIIDRLGCHTKLVELAAVGEVIKANNWIKNLFTKKGASCPLL